MNVEYTSADALMAHGAAALHLDFATKIEQALGKPLPRVEVRVRDLSLTADLITTHAQSTLSDTTPQNAAAELPTLPYQVLQAFYGLWDKKHVVQKHILNNVDAVFKPGTVTLVLGQSGSGKSALMKVLGGRIPLDKRTRIDGDVSFNGLRRETLLPKLPQFVSYVTQTEDHFPTLTIQETLEFAHTCSGKDLTAMNHMINGSAQSTKAAVDATRAVLEHRPALVLRSLGLERCKQTMVGNAMLRGVSGGERKRLTTGEMAFGLKYVVLMDEITTGLDSAAAYDVVHRQRSLAQRFHQTVIISLLQPSPELFALFDNVLVLNEGYVIYYGPRTKVLEYFASLGLVCPAHRDIADFLCDLGTQQQAQYEHSPTCPRDAAQYAELFHQSNIHATLMETLTSPVGDELKRDADEHILPVPTFAQNFYASTRTVTQRQLLLLWRNKPFLIGRGLLVLLIAGLFSSLFHDIDFRKVQVVLGLTFASVLFVGLGQATMLTPFMISRSIFYKQRGANFYRTASYVLASSASQFPIAIGESLLFGSLVYWCGGFVGSAGHFLIFEGFLMLTVLVFIGLFFFLAAISPNLLIAKPLAMVSLLIFILFGGFVVTKDAIPMFLRWLYWLDPVAWSVRAIAVSQYRSAEYDVCDYKGVAYCHAFGEKTMGEYALSLFDVPSAKSWVIGGFLYNIAVYMLLMLLSWIVLEYKRFERPEHVALPSSSLPTNIENAVLSDDMSLTSNHGYVEAISPRPEAHIDMEDTTTEQSNRGVPPVTIAFENLWYTVSNPRQHGRTIDLLRGITGYALPGQTTALMGSSGAGKTTLMDVIAGRKTGGTIRGKILINGFEASHLAMRRCTGYCEQMDIHSEAATFREAITFSAFLRQDAHVSKARKLASVDECLQLLDMEDIADRIVRGSSMEQHKRLTIGVELAAQPSVLFLDEPTSGLDARSAKVIIDGVRKVADSGRTVLCTIHQPSSDVFALFDQLLLLKRGGQVVFFGPLGSKGTTMVDYFQALPGVERMSSTANPATWMLEVIGAGVGNKDPTSGAENEEEEVDFVDAYATSQLRQTHLETQLHVPGLFSPLPEAIPVTFRGKRAARHLDQVEFLFQRFRRVYWRTSSYNLTRLIIATFIGIVFGAVYFDSQFKTYQGINSGLGMIFVSTTFIGNIAFIAVLPLAFEERAAFYRERASETYNALWYFLCFTLVELPYVATSGLLFTSTFFPMVGFTGFGRFLFYWLHISLHILFESYIGQLVIFCFPSIELGAVVGILFNAASFHFMGFNPPAMEIPHGYKWLYQITPHRFTFSALVSTMFGECSSSQLNELMHAQTNGNATSLISEMEDWSLGCQLVDNAPVQVGHIPIQMYLDHVFDIQYEDRWRYTGIIIAIIVIFRVVAGISMRYINHQKR